MLRQTVPSMGKAELSAPLPSPTESSQGNPTKNPVVASLETLSENPYSAVAMSPCRKYVLVACKDTMRLVQIKPSGLYLLKSITMNPFFTDPKRRMPNSTGDSLNLRSFAFGSNQQQPQTAATFISNVVSITDLAWSAKEGESSWIAVAGSSGAVVIWSGEALLESSMASSPRIGQLSTTPENILQQHSRAVNRLAWHPTRPLLLSASQDGTTLLWESTTINAPEQNNKSGTAFKFFGRPETARKEYCWKRKAIFATKGDTIRDIKWSPHHPDLFAGVTSGGSLMVYDCRYSARAVVKTVAHAGNAASVDWHPTRPNIIATGGSSDRCVKIWHVDPEQQGAASDSHIAQNSNTLLSRGADSVATSDSSGTEVVSGPVEILHRLAIAASVTRLRWRPSAPESYSPMEIGDRHESMLAVATAPVQGGAGGGSGLLALWSFRRPFMALSIVEGHKDGAVTDFVWLDIPQRRSHEGQRMAETRQPRRKVVEIPETASRLPSQLPHEPDSILYDNSDNGRATKDPAVGVWQHVLSVGRDGRCLLQSFARGDRPISRVPPSCFAMANLTPLQEGYGSLQVFSVRQKLPYGPSGDFPLTGLRSNRETDGVLAGFRETSADYELATDRYIDRRLPGTPPRISFHVIDQGDLNSAQNPVSEHPAIVVAPEVLHMSRLAERYQLYPSKRTPNAAELCVYNAEVTEGLQQHALTYMWSLLATMLKSTGGELPKDEPQNVLQFVLLPTVRELLEERADAGDVQTCVAICEVLQLLDGESVRIPELHLSYVREWYLSYIQLLSGMCLFRPAAHLVKMSRDPFIGALNQQATTIYESCPHCFKPLTEPNGSHASRRTCPSCRRRVGLCSVCHEPVQGLYVWCAGCGHGGHLDCVRTWFRDWSCVCPTGCGHKCNENLEVKAFPRTDSMESWENGRNC